MLNRSDFIKATLPGDYTLAVTDRAKRLVVSMRIFGGLWVRIRISRRLGRQFAVGLWALTLIMVSRRSLNPNSLAGSLHHLSLMDRGPILITRRRRHLLSRMVQRSSL